MVLKLSGIQELYKQSILCNHLSCSIDFISKCLKMHIAFFCIFDKYRNLFKKIFFLQILCTLDFPTLYYIYVLFVLNIRVITNVSSCMSHKKSFFLSRTFFYEPILINAYTEKKHIFHKMSHLRWPFYLKTHCFFNVYKDDH